MSGGYFDYKQYAMDDIVDQIERLIKKNNSTDVDEHGWDISQHYSEDTINLFKEAAYTINKAAIMAQRIDWLVSGDDGEETFKEQLKTELLELEEESDVVEPFTNLSIANNKPPLELGDYVFVSRWSDCDPNDPWGVGFVSNIDGRYIRITKKDGDDISNVGQREWPRARRITEETGLRILAELPDLEGDFDTTQTKLNDIFYNKT